MDKIIYHIYCWSQICPRKEKQRKPFSGLLKGRRSNSWEDSKPFLINHRLISLERLRKQIPMSSLQYS